MYKFELEPVLNQRRMIEEGLQKELAIYQRELVQEKSRLEELEDVKSRSLAEMQKKQKEGITTSQILLYSIHIEQLTSDIKMQARKVINAQEKLDEKRADLLSATKRRKILETLKEKGFEKYKRGLLKKEQIFLDEVGINRFSRTTKPGQITRKIR